MLQRRNLAIGLTGMNLMLEAPVQHGRWPGEIVGCQTTVGEAGRLAVPLQGLLSLRRAVVLRS